MKTLGQICGRFIAAWSLHGAWLGVLSALCIDLFCGVDAAARAPEIDKNEESQKSRRTRRSQRMATRDAARAAGRTVAAVIEEVLAEEEAHLAITFGRCLRILRTFHGMSQSHWAELLRISPSVLSRIEHGTRRPPDRAHLIAWRTLLDLPVDEHDALMATAGYFPAMYRIEAAISHKRERRSTWETVEAAGHLLEVARSLLVARAQTDTAVRGESIRGRLATVIPKGAGIRGRLARIVPKGAGIRGRLARIVPKLGVARTGSS